MAAELIWLGNAEFELLTTWVTTSGFQRIIFSDGFGLVADSWHSLFLLLVAFLIPIWKLWIIFFCWGAVGYSNRDLFVLAKSGWLTFMSRSALKKSACFDKPGVTAALDPSNRLKGVTFALSHSVCTCKHTYVSNKLGAMKPMSILCADFSIVLFSKSMTRMVRKYNCFLQTCCGQDFKIDKCPGFDLVFLFTCFLESSYIID